MKKAYVTIMTVCVIAFIACQKERMQTKEELLKEKIVGKWMLVKYQEQTYNTSNTLTYNDERIGDQSDSLIFKQDGKLFTYSDTDGNFVDDYQILDDQHIRIEMEDWQIVRLTETEFNLVSEETNTATNERDVVKAFLKRP